MLLEKKPYPDDFPIHISIMEISEYPLHYHQDIEIVYVLKGTLRLKNGYCSYLLQAGDIFTNNGHEVHALFQESENNVVAIIRISNLFFTQYFPELNKSCYRTYSPKESDSKVDILKKTILQLLLIYLQKSFNYKQNCIEAVLELIKLLNSSFNLFAFEKQLVVNFDNDNPVIIERMSRIINYLYENHSAKITLADLAKLEHLSTFYLSHLISECTGMSFREFLCFARAEWSEIYLLDTNKSISTIAKDVGFSTTSYYEKHFIKWFGRSPEEHRIIFKPLVKSQLRPEMVSLLPLNKALGIIKSSLSAAKSQDNNHYLVNHLKLDVHVNSSEKAITGLNHNLEISVTLDDFAFMQYRLFDTLKDLGCNNVIIKTEELENNSNELKLLQNKLQQRGFSVSHAGSTVLNDINAYGLDSIIAPIHILNACFLLKSDFFTVRLRDQGNPHNTLKGLPSLMTSSAIPKPAYYAYSILSKIKGDVICWGKNYSVTRLNSNSPAYIILAYNYDKELDQFCSTSSTPYEIAHLINKFNDELELNISLTLSSGKYFISKYSLDRQNNIFDFMSKMNFPKNLVLNHNACMEIFCLPKMDGFTEFVESSINLDLSFKGLGLQLIMIQDLYEEVDYE